jgi:hypothetical protein
VAGSSDIVAAEVAGVRGAGETEFEEVPELAATAKVVESAVLVIVAGAVELEGVDLVESATGALRIAVTGLRAFVAAS